MKYVDLLLATLFLVFAGIQLNDPDPLYWVCAYLAVGGVAFGEFLGRRPSFLNDVSIGLALAGMLIAAPGLVDYFAKGDIASITASMSSASHVEPAREFLGLAMALAALAWYRRRGLRAI